MPVGGATADLAAAADRRDLRVLGLAVLAELGLLAIYVAVTGASLGTPRYALYPFVWINLGVLAVWHTRVPRAPRRRRWLAAAAAGLYFLVLLWLAGLVDVTLAGNPRSVVGVDVFTGTPGWSRARLVAPNFSVVLLPYRVLGYACLAFLVYATLLETAGAALSGAVGLLSCVGCSFPLAAGLVAGVAGGTAGVSAAGLGVAVDLSTALFVLAVALLYYRPGFSGRAGRA